MAADKAVPPSRFGPLLTALRATSRAELVVGVGLLLVVSATFATPSLVGLDSPKAAAASYMAAEAHADGAALTAASDIRADLAGSADATLLDQRAIKAALAEPGTRPSSIQVSEPHVDGNSASAEVTYREGDATRHARLSLERVFPLLRLHGVWKVKVQPALVTLQVPAAAGDLTVDGIPVHLPTGRSATLALFPGRHLFSSTGPGLLVAQTVGGDFTAATPSGQTVPLKLTTPGAAAAAKAVAAAFAACSGEATAGPSACPQTFTGFGAPTLTWTLVGDPFGGASLKADPSSGIVTVLGHFQMVANADYAGRVAHRASSGGYMVQLQPSAGSFRAGPISAHDVPADSRPLEATDQAILASVGAALTNCARSTQANPPDCPQSIAGEGTNIQWTVQGDPVADAQVVFDGDLASFKVTGTLHLTLDYDSQFFGFTRHLTDALSFPYLADVYWDGHQPVVVTIR